MFTQGDISEILVEIVNGKSIRMWERMTTWIVKKTADLFAELSVYSCSIWQKYRMQRDRLNDDLNGIDNMQVYVECLFTRQEICVSYEI